MCWFLAACDVPPLTAPSPGAPGNSPIRVSRGGRQWRQRRPPTRASCGTGGRLRRRAIPDDSCITGDMPGMLTTWNRHEPGKALTSSRCTPRLSGSRYCGRSAWIFWPTTGPGPPTLMAHSPTVPGASRTTLASVIPSVPPASPQPVSTWWACSGRPRGYVPATPPPPSESRSGTLTTLVNWSHASALSSPQDSGSDGTPRPAASHALAIGGILRWSSSGRPVMQLAAIMAGADFIICGARR
jgi:hypothetical protein